jgi:iron(III) transport system permease protein
LAFGSAILSGCICFGLALSNFTIPTLFQVPVFTERIWLAFSVRLDALEALKNALPSVGMAMFLVAFLGCFGQAYPGRAEAKQGFDTLRVRLGRWREWALVAGAVVVGVTLFWPLYAWLGTARAWLEIGLAWQAGRSAAGNSLVQATMAATLALAGGVFVGARPYSKRALFLSTRLAWLPFLVPGVVLGIIVNKAVSPWSGDSEFPVIVSLVVRYLGFSVAGMVAIYHSLDGGQSDSVRLITGGWWAHWKIAVWPQAGGRILAIWYVTYLLSLWDVETVTLLAPPGGETLAIRIFNLLHYGHASQVKALCLILTALGLFPAVIFQLVSLTVRRRMPQTT